MQHNKDNISLGEIQQNGKTYVRCRWNVSNKHLWNSLNTLGCTPNKSLTLMFPSETVLTAELIPDFLRGYFDGDGCLTYY